MINGLGGIMAASVLPDAQGLKLRNHRFGLDGARTEDLEAPSTGTSSSSCGGRWRRKTPEIASAACFLTGCLGTHLSRKSAHLHVAVDLSRGLKVNINHKHLSSSALPHDRHLGSWTTRHEFVVYMASAVFAGASEDVQGSLVGGMHRVQLGPHRLCSWM